MSSSQSGRSRRRETAPLPRPEPSRSTRSRARVSMDDAVRPRASGSSRRNRPDPVFEEAEETIRTRTPLRPVLPPASPFTPRTRSRVRLSIARSAGKAPVIKARVARIADMSNEFLDEAMAAGGDGEGNDVRQAERSWGALYATAYGSILSEGVGPFTPAHEIITELGTTVGKDVDVDEVTDALDRYTLATFVWVMLRPDAAGKLWPGSKEGDSERTSVHHRNSVLYAAWRAFWSIIPTDIQGNETALAQWLDLATIVYTTYCCPTVETYSAPNGKMPLPRDFVDMFAFPSLKGKAKARWTELLRERKRQLDRNKGKTPLIAYSDFRASMIQFIEQYIYPGPQLEESAEPQESDGPRSAEGSLRASTPLAARSGSRSAHSDPSSELTPTPSSVPSSELTPSPPSDDVGGGEQPVGDRDVDAEDEADATARHAQHHLPDEPPPQDHESPDLGDMSGVFDIAMFAEIAAEMEAEVEAQGGTARDEDVSIEDVDAEDDDLPGGLPTESQLNPQDVYEDEVNTMPTESQLNPVYEDEEDEDVVLPSESQFHVQDAESPDANFVPPRRPPMEAVEEQGEDEEGDELVSEDDELDDEDEDVVLPSESQFHPQDETQTPPHSSPPHPPPRRDREPLFAPREEDDSEDPQAQAAEAAEEDEEDFKDDDTYSVHTNPDMDRTAPQYRGLKVVLLKTAQELRDMGQGSVIIKQEPLSEPEASEEPPFEPSEAEDEEVGISRGEVAPHGDEQAHVPAAESQGAAANESDESQANSAHSDEYTTPDDELPAEDQFHPDGATNSLEEEMANGPAEDPSAADEIEDEMANGLPSESQFNLEDADDQEGAQQDADDAIPADDQFHPDDHVDQADAAPDGRAVPDDHVEEESGSSARPANVPPPNADEGDGGERAVPASTQQPSQAASSPVTRSQPVPNAASIANNTPARPGNQSAFFAKARRRTEEGARFATPSPDPDDDGQQQDEPAPASNRRVTGPLEPPSSARRSQPRPRVRPQREVSPNVLVSYNADDDDDRPHEVDPHVDEQRQANADANDQLLDDSDPVDAPVQVPRAARDARGAREPPGDDEYMYDADYKELREDPAWTIPADYVRPPSVLFGKVPGRTSTYIRKTGPRKWSEADALFLYRQIQQVSMREPNPCKVVEYMHGEHGVRSTSLRYFSAQHMKDKMRVIVNARINKGLPVVGRARHFLKPGHKDKEAYNKELRKVQDEVQKERLRVLELKDEDEEEEERQEEDEEEWRRSEERRDREEERRRSEERREREERRKKKRREREREEEEDELYRHRDIVRQWHRWDNEANGGDADTVDDDKAPLRRQDKGKGRADAVPQRQQNRANGTNPANGHVNKLPSPPHRDPRSRRAARFPPPFDADNPPESSSDSRESTPNMDDDDHYYDTTMYDDTTMDAVYRHHSPADKVVVEIPSSAVHRRDVEDKENRPPARIRTEPSGSEFDLEGEEALGDDDDESFHVRKGTDDETYRPHTSTRRLPPSRKEPASSRRRSSRLVHRASVTPSPPEPRVLRPRASSRQPTPVLEQARPSRTAKPAQKTYKRPKRDREISALETSDEERGEPLAKRNRTRNREASAPESSDERPLSKRRVQREASAESSDEELPSKRVEKKRAAQLNGRSKKHVPAEAMDLDVVAEDDEDNNYVESGQGDGGEAAPADEKDMSPESEDETELDGHEDEQDEEEEEEEEQEEGTDDIEDFDDTPDDKAPPATAATEETDSQAVRRDMIRRKVMGQA